MGHKICLTRDEYDELKYWMTMHYDGVRMARWLAHSLSEVGPLNNERYIPELEALLMKHRRAYCDNVFEKIKGDLIYGS